MSHCCMYLTLIMYILSQKIHYHSCIDTGQVRLEDGSTDYDYGGGGGSVSGRVEIYHDTQWGSVCDDNWNDNNAKVVCRYE